MTAFPGKLDREGRSYCCIWANVCSILLSFLLLLLPWYGLMVDNCSAPPCLTHRNGKIYEYYDSSMTSTLFFSYVSVARFGLCRAFRFSGTDKPFTSGKPGDFLSPVSSCGRMPRGGKVRGLPHQHGIPCVHRLTTTFGCQFTMIYSHRASDVR